MLSISDQFPNLSDPTFQAKKEKFEQPRLSEGSSSARAFRFRLSVFHAAVTPLKKGAPSGVRQVQLIAVPLVAHELGDQRILGCTGIPFFRLDPEQHAKGECHGVHLSMV